MALAVCLGARSRKRRRRELDPLPFRQDAKVPIRIAPRGRRLDDGRLGPFVETGYEDGVGSRVGGRPQVAAQRGPLVARYDEVVVRPESAVVVPRVDRQEHLPARRPALSHQPGNYWFRVAAVQANGQATGHEVSLPIQVVVPHYLRVEFWAVSSALVVAVAVAMGRIAVQRRMQRRIAEIEHEQALDRERARIARDLHDEIGAGLTEIAMQSGWVRHDIAGTNLPDAQIIMLTVYQDPDTIFQALAAGAHGYLVKPVMPERLLEAIRELRAGGVPMSRTIARKVIDAFRQPVPTSAVGMAVEEASLGPREQEVLDFLVAGYSYKEIAGELDIKVSTVGTYVKRIYEKLHVCSRREILARYRTTPDPSGH